MSRKAICKEKIKENTIKEMKNLGVYKVEYTPIIDIYAQLREEYERLTAEFKKNKYKYSETSVTGGAKKSPLVSTLEGLRRDILSYSDRLCLNPKSMMEEKNKKTEKKSVLSEAIKSLGT